MIEVTDLAYFFKMLLSIGGPIGGVVAYFVKKQDGKLESHDVRLEQLELRISHAEINNAVVNTKLEYIAQQIGEVKSGVDRLVDRK